jgi:hypothetical protein
MPFERTYICQSTACRKEIQVPTDETAGKPKCVCGSEMKQIYSRPLAQKFSMDEAVARFGSDIRETIQAGNLRTPEIDSSK